jgi:hypothetical protein
MKKLEEYLQHAQECRDMMKTAQPQHRAQLRQMAETWEELAETRRRQLERAASMGDAAA